MISDSDLLCLHGNIYFIPHPAAVAPAVGFDWRAYLSIYICT